jgi:hypothetical protein
MENRATREEIAELRRIARGRRKGAKQAVRR